MNENEFTILVEDTKGIVLGAVRKYLSYDLHSMIDDVAQETYIRIYKYIGGMNFMDAASRAGWIYSIAKNESLRAVDKYYRENDKIRRFIEQLNEAPGNMNENMSDEISFIREVISVLPDKYRSVFELLIMGFSERQMAEKLSLKQGTIKSRIHRGRELISRNLSKKGALNDIA